MTKEKIKKEFDVDDVWDTKEMQELFTASLPLTSWSLAKQTE